MFWVMRGGHSEGRGWIKRAMVHVDRLSTRDQADGCYIAALCAYGLGEFEQLKAQSDASSALYREIGDPYGEAIATAMSGFGALQLGVSP